MENKNEIEELKNRIKKLEAMYTIDEAAGDCFTCKHLSKVCSECFVQNCDKPTNWERKHGKC